MRTPVIEGIVLCTMKASKYIIPTTPVLRRSLVSKPLLVFPVK